MNCGINLFKKNAPIPKFKACARDGICDVKKGLAVYYTNACPFNEFYVKELERFAKEKGHKVKIIKLATKEQAQNHFVPHTIYSVFNNGKFVNQHILNEKNFDKTFNK